MQPTSHCVFDRVYLILAEESQNQRETNLQWIVLPDPLTRYNALEDEFGPSDLGSVFQFCDWLDAHLLGTDQELGIRVSSEGKKLTNIVFLVGSYMILRHSSDLRSTLSCLEPLMSQTIPYRNVSRDTDPFDLHLRDCLAALERAKAVGWLDAFDVEEYRNLDNPLNADLHVVVPGKLIIMRGPLDLPDGARWRDVTTDSGSLRRDFSPAHYADVLAALGAVAVLRCNAPAYDRRGFEAAGIVVVDLGCEDGAAPPVDAVAKFLAVVERLPAAVAVHCRSGRGRSGTLVALYLMKHHGFSAREAIAWLRIVRPGWCVRPARAAPACVRVPRGAPSLEPKAALSELRGGHRGGPIGAAVTEAALSERRS